MATTSLNKQGKMAGLINWRLRITMQDGRQMAGQMLAFDKHMNMVLADTEEFRRVKRKAPKTAAPGEQVDAVETEEKRSLGLTIVRGAHVVATTVEGPPPADPAARLGAQGGPGAGAPAAMSAGPGISRPAGRGAGIGLQGPAVGVGGPGPAGFGAPPGFAGGFPGGPPPGFMGRGGPPGAPPGGFGAPPPGFGGPPGGPPAGFGAPPGFGGPPGGRGFPPPGFGGR